MTEQGRIQDLIGGGGGPDRDRPKTAILGPQFCRILVLGPHFSVVRGGPGPWGPPLDPPLPNAGNDDSLGKSWLSWKETWAAMLAGRYFRR